MASPYTFIWLILQWIVFCMMIGIATPFFFLKFRKDKDAENKGGAAFNLGYTLFFLFTSLNQLIYIIDATSEYSAAIGWDPILYAGITNTVLFRFTLKSQITIMLCLFFFSFVGIMFPIEKYLRKSEKYPITILLLIGGTTSGIIWMIFCLFLVPQPLEMIGTVYSISYTLL